MIQHKAQHQPSPMSEATLWHLYRRLLGERLLVQHLEQEARRSSPHWSEATPGSGVAAALTENVLEGDTLGLAHDDLIARYLCGMPLAQVREAAQQKQARARRGAVNWAFTADAKHGLLPGSGEDQALLAVGTALSARLHQSGSITVLVGSSMPGPARKPGSHATAWGRAAQTAVALQLPLLFLSEFPPPAGDGAKARPSQAGTTQGNPRRAAPALPSIPVDRDDALALYRVIYESAARARAGGGPTWIECRAWTLPRSLRAAALPGKSGRDPEPYPLEKMEQVLRARKLFNGQQQRHLHQALEKEFGQAGFRPLPRP